MEPLGSRVHLGMTEKGEVYVDQCTMDEENVLCLLYL